MNEPSDDRLRELGTVAFRVAHRILRSRADAEDVAQEAVVRTAIRWRRVHGHADAFVARVATNLSIGVLRKRRPALDVAAHNDGGVPTVADHVDLVRALRVLSPRQREVLVLRYIGDFSEHDIASTLGCSTGSVKQHGSRGLAALRRALPNDPFAEGALDAR